MTLGKSEYVKGFLRPLPPMLKDEGTRPTSMSPTLSVVLFLNNMSRVVYVPARIKEQGQRLNVTAQ